MWVAWRAAPHTEVLLLNGRDEGELLDAVRRHSRAELAEAARRAPAAALRALNPAAWVKCHPRVCAAACLSLGIGVAVAVAAARRRGCAALPGIVGAPAGRPTWLRRLAEFGVALTTSIQRALLGALAARLVFGAGPYDASESGSA